MMSLVFKSLNFLTGCSAITSLINARLSEFTQSSNLPVTAMHLGPKCALELGLKTVSLTQTNLVFWIYSTLYRKSSRLPIYPQPVRPFEYKALIGQFKSNATEIANPALF